MYAVIRGTGRTTSRTSRRIAIGHVETTLGPRDHVAGERGRVRGIGGHEVLTGGECIGVRLLGEWQRRSIVLS
jgi:hypothetical protein